MSDHVASESTTNPTLDQVVPAGKIKSMSDSDKEGEVLMKKIHAEKANKGMLGFVERFRGKIEGMKR